MRTFLSEGHPAAPLLLYVGRLGVEKKIHRLKKVLDANPGCRLVLIGQGPAEESLKKTFEGMPAHFVGQLVGGTSISSIKIKYVLLIFYSLSFFAFFVGEELSQAFASCDIFVMPSDTETLGFVVMEALASGLPSVGVEAGGVVDIIKHGNTGFLAHNDDEMSDFSAYVGKLAQDTALRSNMSKNAVDWAQGWSWEAATSKLRNIQYRKAMELFKCRDAWGRHRTEMEQAIMLREK